jgi:hypothetical protein
MFGQFPARAQDRNRDYSVYQHAQRLQLLIISCLKIYIHFHSENRFKANTKMIRCLSIILFR